MVFNRKITIVQILGIATLVFLGAAAINNNTKEGKNSPSPEIQQLDAKLLVDLQQQEISIDDRTKCLMECAEIQENDLRSLLNINNVNYEKCEAGNCHVLQRYRPAHIRRLWSYGNGSYGQHELSKVW